MAVSATSDSRIAGLASTSVWATLRRARQVSPELTRGAGLTVTIAAVATVGRVLVPVAVQQTVDRGIAAAGGPDVGLVVRLVLAAAVALLLTGVCGYLVNYRIFSATEAGLAQLRVAAFRRVHDLSTLTQNSERRGVLVSRVTGDVDTISQFVQFGGLMLVLSACQLSLVTVVLLVYSPALTLLIWGCFLPFVFFSRIMQQRVSRAYAAVRERMGVLLGAISEAVVGAATIRAYAVQERTARRIEQAVDDQRAAAVRAQRLVSVSFSSGVLVAGLLLAAVVAVGTPLGVGGRLTLGELLAVLFLVQLFTGPVQSATEVLNELQNALAGWRRVIAVLDTPVDVGDPALYDPEGAADLPSGPLAIRFQDVWFSYPTRLGARPAAGGHPGDAGAVRPHEPRRPALQGVDLDIPARSRVAVVGETGSGKTTLARLLTRLVDPDSGRVLLSGVDVRRVRFADLRRRVAMVPQEGFLFDDTVVANIRYGRPQADDAAVRLALTELGLAAWADSLPQGVHHRVGQRGESLSAGERQLVALARAYLANPDLLVLDEATSAVDPATEVRLQRALDSLTRARTSVTIAHRMSTAQRADLVVVMDGGRVVQTGTHRDLVNVPGVYARLYESWTAHHGPGPTPGPGRMGA